MNDPQYASADGSALRIWTDTAQNNFMSEKLGRPNFDEVILVEVISPGSRGSLPVFEVERVYSKEGAEYYGTEGSRSSKYGEYKEIIEKYKANDTSGSMAGTPIAEWPEVSRSFAAALRANEIHTVEALAALPDTALRLVGPDGAGWRIKAQAFLAASKDSGAATALAAENARLAKELEASHEAQKALSDRLTALEGALAAKGSEQPAPEGEPGTVAAPATTAAKPAKAPANII